MRHPTAGENLAAEAAVVEKSPDVKLSLSFTLATSPEALSALIRKPLLLLSLWKAYGFSPRYAAGAIDGGGLHIVDPTGMVGDLFLVEGTNSARRYFGRGAINHRLVPPFRGSALFDLTMAPDMAATDLKVELTIRMENRVVGFFVWAFFPLVRSLAINRISSNINDLGTIAADLATAPKATAARIGPVEGTALLEELGR